MAQQGHQASAGGGAAAKRWGPLGLGVLAISLLAWAALVWLVLDMDHPLARLTMPASPHWSAAQTLAVLAMWATMMAAMMLPSALPMMQAFHRMGIDAAGVARSRGFVAAYLLVWCGFSVAASALQWGLQAAGWVDPMIVSRSAGLTAALLLLAGVYQFSPLKRACLASCRAPMPFLLGQWRPGPRGAFAMGLRHGLFCLGCCWALMALLFVGGAMNLAWVAALSIVVAVEKLARHGERLVSMLGAGLIAAGLWRLASVLA